MSDSPEPATRIFDVHRLLAVVRMLGENYSRSLGPDDAGNEGCR